MLRELVPDSVMCEHALWLDRDGQSPTRCRLVWFYRATVLSLSATSWRSNRSLVTLSATRRSSSLPHDCSLNMAVYVKPGGGRYWTEPVCYRALGMNMYIVSFSEKTFYNFKYLGLLWHVFVFSFSQCLHLHKTVCASYHIAYICVACLRRSLCSEYVLIESKLINCYKVF